ncbi:MAG: 16S rRNA (cytosine(1402)-N(4))-methyltransferase RsmH, partial [Weissella cibaria]
MTEFNHVTVLLNEAIDNLNVKPDGVYVDATLGGGGHSQLLASRLTTGKLWSFDQDITAINYNTEHLAAELAAGKVAFIQNNFRNLKPALAEVGVTEIDGIVYDLGVSSPQFDDGQRGFSYNYDAPLDMRMDQSQELNARTVVN